jgi:DNA polymerase elongation subunit (family B)
MMHHNQVFDIGSSVSKLNDIIFNREYYLNGDMVDNIKTNYIKEKKPIIFLGNDLTQSTQKSDYEIIIHGILPCGSKATIIIEGVYPYIEIECNESLTDLQNKNNVINDLEQLDYDYKNISFTEGRNFMGFTLKQSKYIKIEFKKMCDRLGYIKYCTSKKIITYSNDKSSYYRVVARENNLNLCSWSLIKKYKHAGNNQYKSKYVFRVDIKDIEPYNETIFNDVSQEYIKYDKMIIGSFDIEMCPHNLKKFPDADKDIRDTIFMIAITFHFIKNVDSLVNIVLTIKDSDPIDDCIIIKCDDEKSLLKSFSYIFKLMQPDFITEFNGGGFDWRNIMTKVKHYKLVPDVLQNMSLKYMQNWELDDKMLSRYYDTKSIKINGSTPDALCKSLKLDGYINFDTLVIFKQIEPNAYSHKLDSCLERCNLGSKDSLPVNRMFQIYLEGTKEEMKLVSHYCYIDTVKLQALLYKKNVIQDRREISTISYTSLYDSFYYANGSKVRNLIMGTAHKRNLKFNTLIKPHLNDPDAKYPGAHVVSPTKGIINPMLRLNEYIEKHNLDYEDQNIMFKFIDNHYDTIYNTQDVITDEVYDKFDIDNENKETLNKYIDYVRNTENKYPVSGLDFSSLYPSLIMTYNLAQEYLITDQEYAKYVETQGYELLYVTFEFDSKTIEGWIVQHQGKKEQFGVCPVLLIDLFDQRATLKKILKKYEDQKDKLELEMTKYKNLNDFPQIKEYNEILFNYNYYDSKQKAIKVFMNTFYGAMGTVLSFICAIEVAGGVTYMGKKNLMLAKQVAEEQYGVKTYYGDSVTADTPVIIKRNNIIEVIAIEELWNINVMCDWKRKQCIDTYDVQVYTEDGFINVKKCIRHICNKHLYRVTTGNGIVIVTEDHSLLNSNKEVVKPNDCNTSVELLHWSTLINEEFYATHRALLKYFPDILTTCQVQAQKIYLLLHNIGYTNININVVDDSYILTVNFNDDIECNRNLIKKIEYLGISNEYVYDLETDSHHFAAGIGKIVVHNTDSLYISCNKTYFEDLDKQYFTNTINKEIYMTGLVETTFKAIEECKIGVNKALIENNGHKFLKMAYEEVLYPVIFTGKKKYYGIAHKEHVNFKPLELFIKGLEIVKRGKSSVLKDLTTSIMWESMDIHNYYTLVELVNKGIERYFNTKWNIEDFIKTAIYREDKNNVAVKSFINRMKDMNYKIIPEPNVRFNYIVTKKYPYVYDVKGNQKELSIGDCYELVERVIEENIPIDLDYYFDNEITGQLARLIAYVPEFDTFDQSKFEGELKYLSDKKKYEKVETEIFNNCKKYIKSVSTQFSSPYENKGHLFKETYKLIRNCANKSVNNIYSDPMKHVISALPNLDMNGNKAISIKNHFARQSKIYDNSINQLVTNIIKKVDKSININTYYNDNKYGYVSRMNYNLEREIDSTVQDFIKFIDENELSDIIFGLQDINVNNIVSTIRNKYDFQSICDNNLKIKSVTEIIPLEDLQEIINDEDMYIQLDDNICKQVLFYICQISSLYKSMEINKRLADKAKMKSKAKSHRYEGNEDLF